MGAATSSLISSLRIVRCHVFPDSGNGCRLQAHKIYVFSMGEALESGLSGQ